MTNDNQNAKRTPAISVIVPVYNVEKVLPRCLDSILAQTFADFELICINDGSPDNSAAVLADYAARDARIKIINQENAGLSAARNAGMQAAEGAYICFCDSDDYLDTGFLADLYAAVTAADADFAMTDIARIAPEKTKIVANAPGVLYTFKEKMSVVPNGGCCNKIYKASFLREHALDFPAGLYWEDNIFTVRACYYGNKLVVVNGGRYNYVCSPGSITQDPAKQEKRTKDSLIVARMVMDFVAGVGCTAEEKTAVANFCIRKFINGKDLLKPEFYREATTVFGKNALMSKIRRKQWRRACKRKIKDFFRGLRLFGVKERYNSRKFYFLGLPVFRIKYRGGVSVYNLCGVKITRKSPRKLSKIDFDATNFRPAGFADDNLLRELLNLGKFTFIPNAGNMGDMLIDAATLLFFDEHKLDYERFDGKHAGNTVVYGGGGTWTPDYEESWQNFLPLFAAAEKVVILPSSFYNCPRFLAALDERFTVFCRERRSFDYLRENSGGAKIILDHDMAFRINKSLFEQPFLLCPETRRIVINLSRHCPAAQNAQNKTGLFLRGDCESACGRSGGIDLSDFGYGGNSSTNEYMYAVARIMLSFVDCHESVVTDRLHVGIAGALMGKEVYLLDNSYKKLSGVFHNSMGAYPRVHLVDDVPASTEAGSPPTENFARLLAAVRKK